MEVILEVPKTKDFEKGILHVCGGDPLYLLALNLAIQVFSTYVEVILTSYPQDPGKGSILHVCGGDPPLSSH